MLPRQKENTELIIISRKIVARFMHDMCHLINARHTALHVKPTLSRPADAEALKDVPG